MDRDGPRRPLRRAELLAAPERPDPERPGDGAESAEPELEQEGRLGQHRAEPEEVPCAGIEHRDRDDHRDGDELVRSGPDPEPRPRRRREPRGRRREADDHPGHQAAVVERPPRRDRAPRRAGRLAQSVDPVDEGRRGEAERVDVVQVRLGHADLPEEEARQRPSGRTFEEGEATRSLPTGGSRPTGRDAACPEQAVRADPASRVA